MKLFDPGKIGRLSVKNRIVMAAMRNRLIEPDGRLSQQGIDYYVARVKGGTGLIITTAARTRQIEQLPIAPLGDTLMADARIYVGRLNELAEAAHDYGAKVALQFTLGKGRNIEGEILRSAGAVAPSPLPAFSDPGVTARELTIEEIERLVQGVQFSAEVIRDAGIDAVELNCHAGYLVDQFMTALWNKRTDKYGGDLDGRLRFALELVEAMKKGAGADFPLIYRFSLTHDFEGGREIEEGLEIARRLEAAGVDALNIDVGCYETMYLGKPTTYSPPGSKVHLSAMVKKVVNIPVIANGKLGYPDLAERVLQEEKADFIALGRPLLADPEWPNKVKEGRLEDIRPCLGDHEGCNGRIQMGKFISCTVNPACGMERELAISPADKRKSVLVVGGGPGGMEAARVLALRGHKVTLCEKDYALGGNLILASIPDFKQDYRSLIDYLSTQIKKLGVEIKLATEATPELIQKMKPDAVVLATGGVFVTPQIPGIDRDNVVSTLDLKNMVIGHLKSSTIKEKKGRQKLLWFAGTTFARFLKPSVTRWLTRLWVPFGKRVIVIDGSLGGCEFALYLAQRGKKVTIVEILDSVMRDMFWVNRTHLLKLLADTNVRILTGTNVLEITYEGMVVADKDGKRSTLKADTVVLALGLKSDGGDLGNFKGQGAGGIRCR
ncbi:FAD-dependent oxidoreductase [Chloroflexota bacterium]